MTMWVYQLVESPCFWNPYGIKMMAPKGTGIPMLSFADGFYIPIRFI